jgi:hypothetical protein
MADLEHWESFHLITGGAAGAVLFVSSGHYQAHIRDPLDQSPLHEEKPT